MTRVRLAHGDTRGSDGFAFRLSEREYRTMEDEQIGLCLLCGASRASTEPDARDYPCDACGNPRSVRGIEELLVSERIEIV